MVTQNSIAAKQKARGAGWKVEPPSPEQENERPAANRAFALTEVGNGLLYAYLFNKEVLYTHEEGWYKWDGQRWKLGNNDTPIVFAQKLPAFLLKRAAIIAKAGNDEKSKAIAKWAFATQKHSNVISTIAEARPHLSVEKSALDAHPMLLNTLNCTLNLEKARLQVQDHNRADLLTKLAPVEYDPKAKCPKWIAFLEKVMAGKEQLIKFLQVAAGYSLTGSTQEHVLFLLYGTGRNGKSTFINTLLSLLGDYGATAQFESFLHDTTRSVSASPDLAGLDGARLVAASEPPQGRRLNESLIKRLSGGDTIKAAFKFKNHFEYVPQFKLWFSANHRPEIKGQDEGIWKRVKLIPFTVTISKAEMNTKLPEELRTELPGILNWALEGLAIWHREGLIAPPEVEAATEAYREESDTFKTFLAENCLVDEKHKAIISELYKNYAEWCVQSGEKYLRKKDFIAGLKERGFKVGEGSQNRLTCFGLSLFPGAPGR